MNAMNPLAPASMPSTMDMLAMYRAQFEQDKQELENMDVNDNPFLPKVEDEASAASAQSSQIDQWLAPVSADTHIVTSRMENPEFARNFQEQFENDPAIQEVAEPVMRMAQQLRQAIESGEMTYDEALQRGLSMMDMYAQPVFERHHGDKTKSRTLLSRDPLEIQEEFGAKAQEYADGAKSPVDTKLNKESING